MIQYNPDHYRFPRTSRDAFRDGSWNRHVKPWKPFSLRTFLRLPLYFVTIAAAAVACYIAGIFLIGLITVIFAH